MAISKVNYFNETLIDLTSDTVTAETLTKGTIAHDKSGATITGTLELITYYTGADDPAISLGEDGDIYFKM